MDIKSSIISCWQKPNFKKSAKTYTILFLLIVLISLGAYARFYGLRNHLHLDIDEATHTQTIYNIYKNAHPVLKGPPASGDTTLYHGAYYYYLYLPAAIIGHGNPLALAIFTILLGVASIPLLYFALEGLFGRKTALATTVLYALSYTVILYSRWIWNPNVIPFFLTLAMFSLSKFAQKKEWYLVPFFFALGSISQVHVGSIFLPLVVLPMLPYLLKISKNKKVWAWSIIAFLIPWLPTIGYELRNNFELVRGFHYLLTKPSTTASVSTWDHMLKAYNYFIFMFDTILRLDKNFFVVSILSAISILVYKFKDYKNPQKMLMPMFLLLTLGYTFLASAYYPDLLFIHFVEEIFVLLPLMLGIFVGFLLNNYATVLPGIFIIYLSINNNWPWYQKDLVNGDRQYETEKKICQILKNDKVNDVMVYINEKPNPEYITYVCSSQYQITFGDKAMYHFETDFRDKLQYRRDF